MLKKMLCMLCIFLFLTCLPAGCAKDLHVMADTAVEEAVNLARGVKTGVNAEYPVSENISLASNPITGQMITAKNIDKYLINTGYFTREEVYE